MELVLKAQISQIPEVIWGCDYIWKAPFTLLPSGINWQAATEHQTLLPDIPQTENQGCLRRILQLHLVLELRLANNNSYAGVQVLEAAPGVKIPI